MITTVPINEEARPKSRASFCEFVPKVVPIEGPKWQKNFIGREGIEPSTYGLRDHCTASKTPYLLGFISSRGREKHKLCPQIVPGVTPAPLPDKPLRFELRLRRAVSRCKGS